MRVAAPAGACAPSNARVTRTAACSLPRRQPPRKRHGEAPSVDVASRLFVFDATVDKLRRSRHRGHRVDDPTSTICASWQHTLRAFVTVTWRCHFDEVFVKVNGWPEQANLRTLVEMVFELIDPEHQTTARRVGLRQVAGLRPGGRYRSARRNCTAETEIGTVHAKDLCPRAPDDPDGRLRSERRSGYCTTTPLARRSSRMASFGTATHRLSHARRWRSDLFIMSKFVIGDATAPLDASAALPPAAPPRFDRDILGLPTGKIGRQLWRAI